MLRIHDHTKIYWGYGVGNPIAHERLMEGGRQDSIWKTSGFCHLMPAEGVAFRSFGCVREECQDTQCC